MNDIDAIVIHFEPTQLRLLNYCLALIMFGVALDLTPDKFKEVWRQPKGTIVGLLSQLLLLPIITLLIIFIWQVPRSLALGMLLVAACPGGNISNFFTHFSKGNTALSIAMTTIVTIGAVIIVPLSFSIWQPMLPESSSQIQLTVEFLPMVIIIFQIIIIPIIIGMFVRNRFPSLSAKIKAPFRIGSMVFFLIFVFVAIYNNLDNLQLHVGKVILLVILHNGLALGLSYLLGRSARLSHFDSKAITLETGIQNSGLALILIFNYFDGLGGMALIAATWGIWHLISGMLLSLYWRKLSHN